MLQARHRLNEDDITKQQRTNLKTLLRLFGERRWEMFEVADGWRHHETDVMAVPPWLPHEPVWIYLSRQGHIVLKGWSGDFKVRQLLSTFPPSYKLALKLRIDKRGFARGDEADGWGQFLTNASRSQAERSGLLPRENRAEH